ncbi:MAG: hypothetical protein V1729_05165 [Candidatus Woesearchaeota archaeon]
MNLNRISKNVNHFSFLIILVSVLLISGCTESNTDNTDLTRDMLKLIEIHIDEDYLNRTNHNTIHIADVTINPDGRIDLKVIDNSQEEPIKKLETALQAIQENGTLELSYEDQMEIDGEMVWAYLSKEVLPDDPDYIYAVREALRNELIIYGLEGEIKDRNIIFIDHHIYTYGELIEGEYSGPYIDFPTYEYDIKRSTLAGRMKFDINRSIFAIYGNGFSLNGDAGSGESSALFGLYSLPYENRGVTISQIDPDETVHLEYKNESIILKPGKKWVKTTSRIDKTEKGSAELTETDTIINYGASKIVWD